MRKKSMKTKPATYKFISLNKVLRKELKNENFKKIFDEEMGRLQLAHEIKTLRQKNRMTQNDVARKADMPQSVIARIESGKHSFSIITLHKIAQVFDRQVGLVNQSNER